MLRETERSIGEQIVVVPAGIEPKTEKKGGDEK
jgi:hypothetical protein